MFLGGQGWVCVGGVLVRYCFVFFLNCRVNSGLVNRLCNLGLGFSFCILVRQFLLYILCY